MAEPAEASGEGEAAPPAGGGFAEVFEREIRPKLGEIEAERRRQRARLINGLAITASVCVAFVGGMAIWLGWQTGLAFLLVATIGGVHMAIRLRHNAVTAYRGAVRRVLLKPVARQAGIDAYRHTAPADLDLTAFVRAGLIAEEAILDAEDYLTGVHRNLRFQVVEALASVPQMGQTERTVFRGLLVRIEVPKPFRTRLILQPHDSSLLDTVYDYVDAPQSGQELTFPEDKAFDRRYKVVGDDVEEAREVLTEQTRKSLVQLVKANGGRAPSVAFFENRLLLALPATRGVFEPGSLDRPASELLEDARRLLHEMTLAHRIIDIMAGGRATSLF